jgi:uncharacterized repeat protein (TIGR03803 family)
MKNIGRVLTLIALALLGIGALPAAAQESLLYSFGGVSGDPSQPVAALISDAEGNLYGTSQYGGANSNGAVFELSPKEGGGWTETVLWSFDAGTSGQVPLGSLVFDKDGSLYGTTSGGGTNNTGTIFELSPGAGGVWTEKTLYAFGANSTDGAQPQANLIFDSEGNLYGTTKVGTGTGGYGVVFELSPGAGGVWTEKVLHTFPGTSADGCYPTGGLIFDAEGNLYGTASSCGSSGAFGGAAFELSPGTGGTWTETVLWNFGVIQGDGKGPQASLVFDAEGNLYGTTYQGGPNPPNGGVVFELSPEGGGENGAWSEKVLWGFTGGPADGQNPYDTLILDAQGNLYGTTLYGGPNGYASQNCYCGGTAFELSPATGGAWKETILHGFLATSTDGYQLYSGLFADADGNLYGTTSVGGVYDASRYTNDGTVFELAAAAVPTFSPAPGTYFAPQKVTITSTTTNAAIYYTTNGTTPTTSSTKYSSPIEVSASETIHAFAAAAGNPNSAVVTAAYTILPPPVAPTVALTLSASSITTEQALTVTVAVKGPSGDPTPTGSVTLTSGSYSSAAVSLSSGNGIITVPGRSLTAGSDTLTVHYTPDSASSLNYISATGTSSMTVTKVTPSVGLTLSSSSIITGQVLTVTVAVSSSSGGPTPAGSVTLTSGSYTSSAATLASGSSTISIPGGTLAVGTSVLTVTYTPNSSSSPIYNGATGSASVKVTAPVTNGLLFIPVTPCRIVDTRNAAGAFGGPELAARAARTFDIPQSGCGIPTTAVAYSLNATVVPIQALGYLTVWPAGQAQPIVSTLNSDGRVKANATITPAGTNGGVSVFASDATQFILDIDGYFLSAATSTSGLEFFPVTACRVADTRNATGSLGGPSLVANTARAIPVQSSSCGIPATAKAYSLNVTAVPHGDLGYLTVWPSGQAQPVVSTLNSSTGAVTANAAIVPGGTGGDISIIVSDATDVILDVNGYFAAPASGGLSLHTVTPCRAIDTRNGAGAFDGTLTAPIHGSSCAPPTTAQAYVLNATVVPTASLSYLSLWAAGGAQPIVSTLNASDGAVTSNMAIVTTTNGSIDAFSTDSTNLILDVSSYFAP